MVKTNERLQQKKKQYRNHYEKIIILVMYSQFIDKVSQLFCKSA